MRLELFFTPGCIECATARSTLKAVAQETVEGLEWLELNVLDELDYAVELGVLTIPAIAVDGKLLFSGLPTSNQLREALTRREAESK